MMVERIQVNVRPKLAREISDWKSPTPLVWREQVVARKISDRGWLRVAVLQNDICQLHHLRIEDPPGQAIRKNLVVDARKKQLHVSLKHILVSAAVLRA